MAAAFAAMDGVRSSSCASSFTTPRIGRAQRPRLDHRQVAGLDQGGQRLAGAVDGVAEYLHRPGDGVVAGQEVDPDGGVAVGRPGGRGEPGVGYQPGVGFDHDRALTSTAAASWGGGGPALAQ
jgi:hypothetical protein